MVWIFVLVLTLPSFGGEVRATVEATGPEHCAKLRRAIVQALGGEQNINGTVGTCRPRE